MNWDPQPNSQKMNINTFSIYPSPTEIKMFVINMCTFGMSFDLWGQNCYFQNEDLFITVSLNSSVFNRCFILK